MKVNFLRTFFGGLIALALLAEANLCPVTSMPEPVVAKGGYGVKANAWLVSHIERNVSGGMSAVTKSLRSLRRRVAENAEPVDVTDGILRAFGLDADKREGGLPLEKRKALRSACFAAQFFTHGAIGVCAETSIVGGMFCVPGTHMRACETHYALMSHPSVIEKMGVKLNRKECAAMCLLAQMTCVCRDAIDMPFSQSMRRACRENRKSLLNAPLFETFLRELEGDDAVLMQIAKDWARPEGNQYNGDCSITFPVISGEVEGDERAPGKREATYTVYSRAVGGGPSRVRGCPPQMPFEDARDHCLRVADETLFSVRTRIDEFDASALAGTVAVAPSRIWALHGMELTTDFFAERAPAFRRKPTDPGPKGDENPRFQEPGGKGRAVRWHGVDHPAAGTPLGDHFGGHAYWEAVVRGDEWAVQQHSLGYAAVDGCELGAPMPMGNVKRTRTAEEMARDTAALVAAQEGEAPRTESDAVLEALAAARERLAQKADERAAEEQARAEKAERARRKGVERRLAVVERRLAVVPPDAGRAPTAASSDYFGVTWHTTSGRWMAFYTDADGERHACGCYATQERAAVGRLRRIRRERVERKNRLNPIVSMWFAPRVRKSTRPAPAPAPTRASGRTRTPRVTSDLGAGSTHVEKKLKKRKDAPPATAAEDLAVGARVALGGAPGVLTAIEDRGWYKVRLDGEETVRSARRTKLKLSKD